MDSFDYTMSAEPLLPRNEEPLLSLEGGGTAGSTDERNNPDSASNEDPQCPKIYRQITRVIMNLLSATTGTSTISVPLMALTLGLVPTILVMTLQSALGVFTDHVISQEAQEEGRVTYQKLLSRRISPKAGKLVAAAIVLNGAGKLVLWIVIMTDVILGAPPDYTGLLPEILRNQEGGDIDASSWYMKRPIWALLLALLSVPGISIRSLDKISWVSSIGDIAVLFMAVSGAVLASLAASAKEACGMNIWPSSDVLGVHGPRFALKIAAAFPVLISSVFNQHTILSVAGQLHPYSQRNLDVSTSTAAVTILVTKLSIGFTNVLLFGFKTKSDVLLNYSRDSLSAFLQPRNAIIMATSVKVAFLLNGALSFPLYLWPLQSNFWGALYGEDGAKAKMNDRKTFALTNYAVVAACAAVAAVVHDVQPPLALLGATVVGYLAFVAPALLVLRENSHWQRQRGARLTAKGMLLLGVFQAIAGILSVLVK
jgi:amino acid permease